MVTPDDIADELGKERPDVGTPLYNQWSKWIDRAYRAIEARAAELGVDYDSLNVSTVDDVVTYAVALRAGRPVDGAISVTEQGSIDDFSMQESRRYGETYGDLFFLDRWWALLGLSAPVTGGWSGSMAYTR